MSHTLIVVAGCCLAVFTVFIIIACVASVMCSPIEDMDTERL